MTATKQMLGQLNALAWGSPPIKSETTSTMNRASFGNAKSKKEGETKSAGGTDYATANSRSGNPDFDFNLIS